MEGVYNGYKLVYLPCELPLVPSRTIGVYSGSVTLCTYLYPLLETVLGRIPGWRVCTRLAFFGAGPVACYLGLVAAQQLAVFTTGQGLLSHVCIGYYFFISLCR